MKKKIIVIILICIFYLSTLTFASAEMEKIKKNRSEALNNNPVLVTFRPYDERGKYIKITYESKLIFCATDADNDKVEYWYSRNGNDWEPLSPLLPQGEDFISDWLFLCQQYFWEHGWYDFYGKAVDEKGGTSDVSHFSIHIGPGGPYGNFWMSKVLYFKELILSLLSRNLLNPLVEIDS